MKGEMTEESVNKVGMIILAVVIIIVLMYVLNVGFKGSKPVRTILCAILWLLPGGGVLSGYIGCGAIPV